MERSGESPSRFRNPAASAGSPAVQRPTTSARDAFPASPGNDCSQRAAAGNLKKALAYLEQNQISPAIVQLRQVIASYGGVADTTTVIVAQALVPTGG